MEEFPVFKKENLLYEREEKKGFITAIPKYHPETRELVINQTGRMILKLCDGKTTMEGIVEKMHNKFPQIEKEKISKDVMTILSQYSRLRIIEWMGGNPFLWRKETPLGDDYTAMIAQEDDLSLLKKFIDENLFQQEKINNKKELFFYKSPFISYLDYHELSIRAKIFNFIEEFFLLFKKDKLYGIISISPPLPKQPFSIATINFVVVPLTLWKEFFKYAYDILPFISISRITKLIIYESSQKRIALEFKEALLKEGFEEEAILQDEIDFSENLKRFTKYYSKSLIEQAEKQKGFYGE